MKGLELYSKVLSNITTNHSSLPLSFFADITDYPWHIFHPVNLGKASDYSQHTRSCTIGADKWLITANISDLIGVTRKHIIIQWISIIFNICWEKAKEVMNGLSNVLLWQEIEDHIIKIKEILCVYMSKLYIGNRDKIGKEKPDNKYLCKLCQRIWTLCQRILSKGTDQLCVSDTCLKV